MSLAECIKTAGTEIDARDAEALNRFISEGMSDSDALTALYSAIDKEQTDLAEKIKQSGGVIDEETTSITGPEGLQSDGRIRGSEGDVDSPVRQDASQAQQNEREADGSLRGLPRNIEGFEPRHSAVVESVATAYMASVGLGYMPPSMYRPVVISRAKRIAVAYEEMEHNPNDPEVKAAYEALASETVAQYKAMLDAGVVVEFTDVENTGDPYAKNPRMVNDDIVDNNHMWVFPTNDGFGTDETFESSGNPLLAESEFMISGRVALVNDLFRAVHDYFGHAKESLGTRAGGEENAWRMHSAMFTPMAQRALTTETRGQNSWVNFGPNAEKNKTARGEDTVFADQKIGLMPEWVSMEGVGDEVSIDGIAMKLEMLNPNFLVGKTIKPTPADLTGGGRAYTGIDSSTVSPIELQGGPIFPLLDSFFDMGIAWAANDKTTMRKLQGTNYVVVSAMSNEAHRSNATVIQSLLSTMDAYVRDGRISDENIKGLEALIKGTGERISGVKDGSFAGFTGLSDPIKYHAWAESLTFNQRMVLAKTLESAQAQKLGAPNFQKIMNSIIDSQYAGHNLHDSQLVIEIDQSPDALVELGTNGTKKHRSYKYGVKGRVIGVLPRPVRRDVLFSSWRQAFDAKSVEGAKTNPDRAFQLSLPTQMITQDIANDIASKPYAAISSPKQAKLALNFKRDLWKVSGLTINEGGVSQKDFIAAVAASPSSSTLSEVNPTELRKAVSAGATKIFQLKDGQIFFALNLGLNYNTVYSLNNAELNDSDVALASVVNNEASAKGIASPAVMLKAIEEGVTVLDAFAVPSLKYADGFLPALYAEFGFETIERMPFDLTKSTALELADMKHAWRQDGWDESKGLPDLVIMKWRGTDEQRQNARQRWIDGSEGSADSIISPATAKSNREAKKLYGEAISDANGQAGREGNGSSDTGGLRASERTISGRLRDVLKELDGLTESERKNLGLDKYNPAGDKFFQRAQDSAVEPFYSGLLRGLTLNLGEKVNSKQLIEQLNSDSLRGKWGIKQEEVEWLGITDWLSEQGKTVTKQEVLDFVALNQVTIKEVKLGSQGADNYSVMWGDIPEAWFIMDNATGDPLFDDNGGELLFGDEGDALDYLDANVATDDASGPAKYSSYTVSGDSTGYRELLLSLPQKSSLALKDGLEVKQEDSGLWNLWDKKEGDWVYRTGFETKERLEGQTSGDSQLTAKQQDDYRSTHFDTPNILAHVRYDERTDADGNRILFINEIQSDWHQDGRKKGYKRTATEQAATDNEIASLKLEISNYIKSLQAKYGESGLDQSTAAEREHNVMLGEKLSKLEDTDSLVSNAPLKGNSWVNMAMKRMIRHAAENGFDKVAWATGQQSADLYSLSSKVDKISSRRDMDGVYVILTEKDGQAGDGMRLTEAQLPDYLGKELATKIIDKANQTTEFSDFSGLDLSVGGDGMKGFYDRTLPNLTNKYIKKWGAKVGSSVILQNTNMRVKVTDSDLGGKQDAGDGYWKGSQGIAWDRVHSFEVTPEMRDSAMQGQPLFQGGETVRGYYDPENVLIRLTEAANLSTFLHEFAHFMLDMEQKMGGSRLPAINDWFVSIGDSVAAEASEYTGFMLDAEDVAIYIENGTTGDGVKDGAILRSTHEHFARGFETYLMEGKSPSSALGSAFAKFALWLNDVYKREMLNKPNIDGQMRETFALLLASQEQIENAEARYRYSALFPDAKTANMTDKQWAAYMDKVSGSKAKSVETLRNRLIAELVKISDAERNGEKAEEIEIAIEKLKETDIYITIEKLKGELKMDWQSVKDILKTNMPPQLKNMTTRYGNRMLADDAAREAGYGSGSEMINALMKTKPIAEQAEIMADAVLKKRYGDITDNASIMQQVDEAIHNETRGELILLEVRALARGKPDVDKQALQLLAQQAIAKLNYRNLRPDKYHTQEIEAAKKSAVALAAGEPKKALMYKERQAANFFLYKEAIKARAMAEKGAERMKRYDKKTIRKTLGLAGNGYLEQIDGILHRFDFRKSAPVFNVQKWAEERFLEYGDGLVLTDLVLTDADPVSWKDLPVGELEGVLASIANIEHVARYIHKIDVAGESLKYEEAVARALAVGEANNKDKFKPQRSEAEKPLGASDFGAQILAEMTKVGTLTRILDGHADVGIWHQLIMQRITDGGYYKNQLHDMAFKPVIKALKNRSKEDIKRHVSKVFIPELKNTDASGVENDGNMYGSQLISVILNTGNAENLQKMIKGEGWGDDYTANNPIIQAVLAKLTRSDLELIQLIWDQMDMLYEPMAAVHQRTSGVRPPKVAATQLVTEHGTFKGGYFPLAYDYLRSDKAAKFKDAADKRSDQMFENNGGMTSSIKAGATNERQEGFFAPIRFSLDVVAKHFDEVTHFIAFKEPVREVNKLISDPRIKEIIIRKMGRESYRVIQDWVVDVATDARPLEGANWMERTLSNLSSGLTLGVMGFKASTGIIQISGLSNSIAHVGAGPMAIALKNIVRSPSAMKEAWQFTLANSKIMSHRMTNLDREMKSALREMSGKSGFMNRLRELSMQHIAYIQTFTVDLPTWHAAYATALEESNGDTVHASQAADWVVENIQGSGATKDMAKLFRRQNAGIKLMTMFMTFFSALFNTMRLSGAGFRTNRYSIFDMATRFFFMIAVPVAFEMIMRDEIDPDEPEEALIAYGKKAILFPLAAVPLLRDASSAVLSPFGFQLSPLSGSLERGFQGLTGLTNAVASGEDITLSQAANSMALAGIVFRVPATSQIKATTSHLFDDHDLSLHELLFGTKRD